MTEVTIEGRRNVLALADDLGNISEACRRCGMTRSQFYEYKRRYHEKGLEGLKNLPFGPRHHPFTTSPEVVQRILDLSIADPTLGCDKLHDLLKAAGILVSSPTIQKILINNEMGTVDDRFQMLEDKAVMGGERLTEIQTSLLEKHNPCFRERNSESNRPAKVIVIDKNCIGRLKGKGKVWLIVGIDTFCGFAFGSLLIKDQYCDALSFIYRKVISFYQTMRISSRMEMAINNGVFNKRDVSFVQQFLNMERIDCELNLESHSLPNGFVQRFTDILLAEFRLSNTSTIGQIQRDLDGWLTYYNTIRPFLGYPNFSKTPIDRIKTFIQFPPIYKQLSYFDDW